MKPFAEEWMRGHESSPTPQSKRVPRTKCIWTSNWVPRETRSDWKAHLPEGNARAATAAVDARLRGDKKLLQAKPDVCVELAKVSCKCRVIGNRTCTALCLCQAKWKSCGVECGCNGFCCNSFFYTPQLNIRQGALGEELYTKCDLPQHRICFVVCGPFMTVPEYRRYHEKLLHKPVKHYGVRVSWPGSLQDLPGSPDMDKYVIDPFDDMTGAVNHCCEPNIVIQACWANKRIYAVGRTKRSVMAKEALTLDYKWPGTGNAMEFAEICLCRQASCRGFIADPQSTFMDFTIIHYDREIARLQKRYANTEKTLQHQSKALTFAKTTDLEVELIKNEDDNAKLKATIEHMISAVTRAKASQPAPAEQVVEQCTTFRSALLSPLRRLGHRLCFRTAPSSDNYQQNRTVETLTSSPNSVSTPMANTDKCGISMDRSDMLTGKPHLGPLANFRQKATRPQIPRLAILPRP